MSDLFVNEWGSGVPVVLAHGSLAIGADEWPAQRPLADQAFRLLAPDRRGYGQSPAAQGEDYLADAEDLADLMGEGAHLVGHSYGGLGLLYAAARHPKRTLSLTVLETPIFLPGQQDEAVRALLQEVRDLWVRDLPDEEWVMRFLRIVGSDPADLSPELIASAVTLLPVFRRGRPFWQADPPLDELKGAGFPKLVVSGGHHPAFESMCDALAEKIGAERKVIAGAGHEIQFVGAPLNDTLLTLWRGKGA